MLLVLYGSTAEIGFKSREFFISSGFELIEKLNWAPEDISLQVRYGERKWVTKEEFFKKTDSLFRYEIGGIHIGFNQNQILEAVSNDSNRLLTLSPSDVSFLREIKEVYNDTVRIIYCYIDKHTLDNIVSQLPNIAPEEAKLRLDTGATIRQQYSLNSDIFDYVVIYNGENNEFDFDHLRMQYETIIDSLHLFGKVIESHDIFLSYAHKDVEIVNAIRDNLKEHGLDVFNDSDIAVGKDWSTYLQKEISSAKIFVPIITKNTLSSELAKKEIEEALEVADDNANIVIPIFLDSDINVEGTYILDKLTVIEGVICEDGNINEASEKLALIIKKLLNGLDNLERLSEQVNNYIYIKEYEKALKIQEEYCDLCFDLFKSSNGKYVGLDVMINSEIKLISILIDMKDWEKALDEAINAISMLDDESNYSSYNALKEQFAICCVGCNYSEEKVSAIIEERINTYKMESKYLGKAFDHFNIDLCKELFEEFSYIKKQKDTRVELNKTEEACIGEKIQIAKHGEAAMKIFDGLVNAELTEQTRGSMVEGYQRVLNYCIQLGLSEQISAECIKKIAELKEINAIQNTENSAIANALKVFLGQAAPGSGNYDVFISFKSEDVNLAKKVNDFLKQSGKEVFFSKESLPQLGESEYEDAIYQALDHSKHMVLVASNPEYLKTDWVSREWKYFNNRNRKSDNKGNIVIILQGEYVKDTEKLPPQLRYDFEIIGFSEFKNNLLSYLR